MAMRDPGTPGHNPFLDGSHDDRRSEPRDPRSDRAARPDLAADALGTLAALVDALGDAQPEAAEHLVAAAHEMVLVVKTVVDAVEVALGEQRASMQAAREASAPGPSQPSDPGEDPFLRRVDLG